MDLATMDVLQFLRDKIREDIRNYTDDLANGQCTDFAVYKQLCGVIRGLGHADGFISDLAKKMEYSDD